MKTSNKLMIGLTITSIVGKVIEKMMVKDNVRTNTQTSFNKKVDTPMVKPSTYIHHHASVIGSVNIMENVFVGPFSSIRGDEGLRIHIGSRSNIQDGVVIHGIKNYDQGSIVSENNVFEKDNPYSVYVGENVSIAHQSQIHGPSKVSNNVFVGMQALVFKAIIEENVILEPGCKVIGVTIPKNRYVSAGRVITKQEEADQLPEITPEYNYFGFNPKVVAVNLELVNGYKKEEDNKRNQI
ncbi:carbonic anhydrase [Bacillus sp. 31A1R]|uniref:Carbonic anhydrase n=1 Tax=Robertmurraya mangrovi TaxID=3098077 RepID=A0ABU5J2Y9_9BACI|nr:carbonic anhydrase [Bacillus sp. 31A1R]MDZ5473769.1 carbonic anhydrase [Bacillus sp. 31A1R]